MNYENPDTISTAVATANEVCIQDGATCTVAQCIGGEICPMIVELDNRPDVLGGAE